ncbi:MAG: SufD family Fe-S cluster assembly protein [Anaerolineaceae bacterium]|nr:SufD family Fe-S cluster assembly protein [Anaerolineaceae bacterium]
MPDQNITPARGANRVIDLSTLTIKDDGLTQQISPAEFPETDTVALAEVGVLFNQELRSGTYVMRDFHSVCAYSSVEGLEILPIAEAIRQYDWLRERYYWHLIGEDEDQITRFVAQTPEPEGFFLRVRAGYQVQYPYQTALYMASANIAQAIHNVVILEEGAELELITGCVTHHRVAAGAHFAVSEFYVGKNAKLTNTMVHSWGPDVTVRPRAATEVAEGGRFISNYVSLRTAADIVSNPKTILNGEGASAQFMSVILAESGSYVNTGAVVELNAPNTSAELKHRGVSTGGQIFQGGLMIGNNACRAHVDCSGMLINAGSEGYIQSIPGIRANDPNAQLSHEASIGKISPEQVEYLMSRGFTESEAVSMIIRGFLDAGISGLGEELDAAIQHIADIAAQAEG